MLQTQKTLKFVQSKYFKELTFFVSEILGLIIIYVFALYSFWIFVPKTQPIFHIILSILIILNFYNISKHFIYVRIILWKKNLEQRKEI